MYQRARKLRHLISSTSEVSLVKETCEAYLIALNSLSLADPKTAWMILPGAVDSEHEVGDGVSRMTVILTVDSRGSAKS